MTEAGSISETETPRVVAIGGLDSSGGAGLVADAEAIFAQGAVPCCVATALSLQTDTQYLSTDVLETERVAAQLQAAFAMPAVGAVKMGMLANADIAHMLVDSIRGQTSQLPLVIDPVFASTSGGELLDDAGIEILRSQLLPFAKVVTPNVPEAARLSGLSIASTDDMSAAAHRILDAGCGWVLLKGGHLDGGTAADLLVSKTEEIRLTSPMLHRRNVRGTGCRLASALAARLALGEQVPDAVRGAKAYVYDLIKAVG